jgi:hypothetical protein
MKTVKNLLVICLITLLSATYTQAQTADEVLNKYWDAVGGKAKWKALKSMTQIGKAPSPQGEFPITIYSKAPNKTKIEVSVQGKTMVIQAFDGKDAWNSQNMNMEAVKMNEEQTKEIKDGADFEPKFMDYAAKGHKVTLEGKETLDGTECFKVKLTKKDGTLEYYFFDTENYAMIVVRSYINSGPSKGTEIDTYLSDYKDVNGLMMPFSIEQKLKGQTVFKIALDTIKVDEAIDDKVFAMPAPAGK